MLFLLALHKREKTSKLAITICLMYMTIIYLEYVVGFHSIGKKPLSASALSVLVYVCSTMELNLTQLLFYHTIITNPTELPLYKFKLKLCLKENMIHREN